jgi:hypoxanthine-DNA glycosylase
MSRVSSFTPVAGADATILILGSMPGAASLAAQRYYAHPANAFWPILGAVLGFDPHSEYPLRLAALRDHGIALWDVLQHCEREGSLDSAIRPGSERANDFARFFVAHRDIRRVLFNGAKAEQSFRRHVAAALWQNLELVRLPSTSPAHAGLDRGEKLAAWRAALGR